MGIASSNLPLISTVVLEFTILPLIMSMWWNSRSLLGFGMTLFLLGWEYAVRFAFNLDNPVSSYLGTEQYEAQMIFVGVLGIMAVLMALLGQFTAYVFDLPELLPLWTLLPTSRRTPLSFRDTYRRDLVSDTDGELSEAREADDFDNQTGLQRNGIMNIPRPTTHCVVVLILFLFTVVAPHIIYSLVMDEHKIAAVVCIILIPACGYILLGLYCYYMADLYIFGITRKNAKAYNSFNATDIKNGKLQALPAYVKEGDNTKLKELEKETRERVILTVLIIGIIHVASNLVLALVRYFQDDIDWNWITAAIIGGIILIFTIIVGVYFWWVTNARDDELDDCCRRKKKAKQTDESDSNEAGADENVELDTASYYGSSAHTTSFRNKLQQKDLQLGSTLLGQL